MGSQIETPSVRHGDERRHLLRVVMGERVGTLYRSQSDHAIVVNWRLQEFSS